MKLLLLLLVGFTALAFSLFGVIFISYPDGSVFNLSLDIFSGSPLKNYLIPGIFLALNGAVYILSLLYHMEPTEGKYNWALAGGILTVVLSLSAIVLFQTFFFAEWIGLVIGFISILLAVYLKGKWIV